MGVATFKFSPLSSRFVCLFDFGLGPLCTERIKFSHCPTANTHIHTGRVREREGESKFKQQPRHKPKLKPWGQQKRRETPSLIRLSSLAIVRRKVFAICHRFLLSLGRIVLTLTVLWVHTFRHDAKIPWEFISHCNCKFLHSCNAMLANISVVNSILFDTQHKFNAWNEVC